MNILVFIPGQTRLSGEISELTSGQLIRAIRKILSDTEGNLSGRTQVKDAYG